ncbi:MAG: DNA-binding HxlR family transcriptional regulator [Candidatus Azotimanducaceae bacterium]|jgi:DNA-binding HxlR family transcriptional regulator|tara:strand:- start:89 stop:457 length:369 start_codon:yes stop_codon:yes gene_type:complete
MDKQTNDALIKAQSRALVTPRVKRSECGIASALDLMGDKWTLLIMRDALFFDCRTFADFSNRPERIPTNLLSERLKRLVTFGALKKVAYQSKPQRFEYVPTKLGSEMKPLLKTLRAFGDANL